MTMLPRKRDSGITVC